MCQISTTSILKNQVFKIMFILFRFLVVEVGSQFNWTMTTVLYQQTTWMWHHHPSLFTIQMLQSIFQIITIMTVKTRLETVKSHMMKKKCILVYQNTIWY